MASRTTYIYRVLLGKNGTVKKIEYCYARNAKTAEAYYKEKYKEEKYDMFMAVAFGDADTNYHPGPIEELPEDEVEYIQKNNLGNAEKYSYRKDEKGMFIPVGESV